MFRSFLNHFLKEKDEKVLLIGENHSDNLCYNILSYNADLIKSHAAITKKPIAIIFEGLGQALDIEKALFNPNLLDQYDHQLTFEKMHICYTLFDSNVKLLGSETEVSDPTINMKPGSSESISKLKNIHEFLKSKRTRLGNREFSNFINKIADKYSKIILVCGKAHLLDLYDDKNKKMIYGMHSRIHDSISLAISKTEENEKQIKHSHYYHSTTGLHGRMSNEIQTALDCSLETRIMNLNQEEILIFFAERIYKILDTFNLLSKDKQSEKKVFLQVIHSELNNIKTYSGIELNTFRSRLNDCLNEKLTFNSFFTKEITIGNLKKELDKEINAHNSTLYHKKEPSPSA